MAMLKDKKLFLFDIDGTLAVGKTLLDGTRELLAHIAATGGRALFITNNSTKSVRDYVTQFRRDWALETTEGDFFTAGLAAARYLSGQYGAQKLFVLGTRSFCAELRAAGLNVVTAPESDVACVVVGYDDELNYAKITAVCELLQTQKVGYVATNPDLCCPAPFGFVPDCGAICRLLACAVGREPLYIGKPARLMIDLCLAASGYTPDETLVVGDRLYTDIAAGKAAGVETAVVFTGEAKPKDLETTAFPPDYAFDSVLELYRELIGD